MEPLRSGDPIAATAWIEDAPDLEGDDVHVHAQLSDVDEVALIVETATTRDPEDEVFCMHLPRVQAIALAGQLAAAATMSPALLPHGHGPTGPLVS